MKKYGLRILVGLIAFAIGVSGVIVWIYSEEQPNREKESLEKVEALAEAPKEFEVVSSHRKSGKEVVFKPKKSGKVEIHFIGFTKGEDGTIAEVEIFNSSPKTIYYWSVSKGFVDTHIELNGIKSKPIAICGNVAESSKEFPLLSGETMKVTMPLDRMAEFSSLSKQNKVRLGYYLQLANSKNPQIFWSEKFELPNWVKDEISKTSLE